MEKNVFLKHVSDAESETLLLSSQVMLNELARRYLESRQKDKDKESEQTDTQQPHTAICAYHGDCYWYQGTGKICTCSLPCPHKDLKYL